MKVQKTKQNMIRYTEGPVSWVFYTWGNIIYRGNSSPSGLLTDSAYGLESFTRVRFLC